MPSTVPCVWVACTPPLVKITYCSSLECYRGISKPRALAFSGTEWHWIKETAPSLSLLLKIWSAWSVGVVCNSVLLVLWASWQAYQGSMRKMQLQLSGHKGTRRRKGNFSLRKACCSGKEIFYRELCMWIYVSQPLIKLWAMGSSGCASPTSSASTCAMFF